MNDEDEGYLSRHDSKGRDGSDDSCSQVWEEEEEELQEENGAGKKFKCLDFHTVNLAVQSFVAPFSHSSPLLSETC